VFSVLKQKNGLFDVHVGKGKEGGEKTILLGSNASMSEGDVWTFKEEKITPARQATRRPGHRTTSRTIQVGPEWHLKERFCPKQRAREMAAIASPGLVRVKEERPGLRRGNCYVHVHGEGRLLYRKHPLKEKENPKEKGG